MRCCSPSLLLVLLCACQGPEYSFQPWVDPNLSINSRLIDVDPDVIDFGHIEIGDEGAATITVRNIGLSHLSLSGLEVVGYGTFVVGEPSALKLAPEEEATVPVSYRPEGFERATASVVITSSDPVIPEISVGLAGRSSPPVMRLRPPAYDYGLVYLGCGVEQDFEIVNEGEGRLRVDRLALVQGLESFTWELTPPTSLPLVIEPGEGYGLSVSYSPAQVGSEAVQFDIHSNDPERPVYEGALFGEGLAAGEVVDRFQVVAPNSSDILFVVDNSNSMSEEQSTLVCNFSRYLEVLRELGVDFHIGVITTDNPVLQGDEKVITLQTRDPEAAFTENVTVGFGGNNFEQGLEMTRQALTYPLIASQNQGFLRDEANLRIVFISDEDDHSPIGVPEFTEWLRTIKPDPTQIVASAITGDMGTGCGLSEDAAPRAPASECPSQSCGQAASGAAYIQVADSTGGVFASICSCDFIGALESIAYTATNVVRTFLLTRKAIPETVRVTVNSAPDTRFTYSPDLNAVTFNEDAIPAAGSQIAVTYEVAAECSD